MSRRRRPSSRSWRAVPSGCCAASACGTSRRRPPPRSPSAASTSPRSVSVSKFGLTFSGLYRCAWSARSADRCCSTSISTRTSSAASRAVSNVSATDDRDDLARGTRRGRTAGPSARRRRARPGAVRWRARAPRARRRRSSAAAASTVTMRPRGAGDWTSHAYAARRLRYSYGVPGASGQLVGTLDAGRAVPTARSATTAHRAPSRVDAGQLAQHARHEVAHQRHLVRVVPQRPRRRQLGIGGARGTHARRRGAAAERGLGACGPATACGATAPSASRTSSDVPSRRRHARRRPTPARTRTTPGRAPCGSASGAPRPAAGSSTATISSPGASVVSRRAGRRAAGGTRSSGIGRASPSGPCTCTSASSAASATAMSDGWVAMHAGDAPRIARLRCSPSIGRAAAAGLALVARRGDVLEVAAAGALQQVAADRRHVAQLARRAGEQRLRQHRVALPHQRVGGQVAVAHARADAQPAVGGAARCRRAPRRLTSTSTSGVLDAELHEVDQVGAAAEEPRLAVARSSSATASRTSAGRS